MRTHAVVTTWVSLVHLKGEEQMDVRVGLDWLAVSFRPANEDRTLLAVQRATARSLLGRITGRWARRDEIVRLPGKFGYRERVQDKLEGWELLYLGGKPGMGMHLIASGSTLHKTREREGSLVPLVFRMASASGVPSRIDVALDVRNGTGIEKYLQDARRDIVAMDHRTSVRWFTGAKPSDGTTIYIGRPSSKRQCRIYDKAAQLEIRGETWVRIELVLRKGLARSAWADVVAGNLERIMSDVFSRWRFPSVPEWVAWSEDGFPRGVALWRLIDDSERRMTKGEWAMSVIRAIAEGVLEIGQDRFLAALGSEVVS